MSNAFLRRCVPVPARTTKVEQILRKSQPTWFATRITSSLRASGEDPSQSYENGAGKETGNPDISPLGKNHEP